MNLGFPDCNSCIILQMKSCPKCGRAYDDASLNFCLDDGEWLVDDTAEGEPTRSMPPEIDPGEAATRYKVVNTDETAILPTGSIPGSSAAAGKPNRSKLIISAVVGLIVVAAGGYGIYRWMSVPGDAETEPRPEISLGRLTGDGRTREAAVSPDGKFLAYLQVENEKESLWVRQIETNSTVEILKEGDFAAITNLTFSPDGNFVFFGGIEAGSAESVYKVATLGGSPLKTPIETMSFSLSRDGEMVAYYGENPTTSETWLSLARLDGSDVRKIVSRTGKKFVKPQTAWSPDGNYVAFVEGDDDALPGPDISLTVYSIKDGKESAIVSHKWTESFNEGLAWDNTGRYVYLMAQEPNEGISQLWRISFPNGETVKLTSNQKDYFGISVTADGNSIVTVEQEGRSGVWVSEDLDPNKAVEVFPARGDTWGLDWTPDGRIVYVSDQSGAPEVWVMNPDGTGQKQLTTDRIPKMLPVASPDGKEIVYYHSGSGSQIYIVPVSGGTPRRLNTELVSPADPSYSPDGRWIVYSAWTGGKNRIYRVPASGGKSERLTDYTAFGPRYSPDGSAIACFSIPDGESRTVLAMIPAEGGPPIKTFEIPVTSGSRRGPVWTPDGKSITFMDYVGERSDLWAQPIDGSPRFKLTDFGRPWLSRRAYSKDGKRIALTRGEIFWNAVMLKGLK